MQRSTFIAAALGAPLALAATPRVEDALAAIEERTGGRLGVAFVDHSNGRTVRRRDSERFIMCSTFKAALVGCVLSRVDRGQEHLSRAISYGKSDLLSYAPVTTAHVADGSMPVEALCAAAVELSDNTAANLLLASVGGPAALTRWLRSTGDAVTRLDRNEPSLNTYAPHDMRDTTTPGAMAATLWRLLYGSVLAPASRERLRGWMQRCTTGTTLLRAGAPPNWTIGDKTGMGGATNAHGDSDTRNDIAVFERKGRAPIILAVYLCGTHLAAKDRDAAVADVARLLIPG